jgi:hypothetical protein
MPLHPAYFANNVPSLNEEIKSTQHQPLSSLSCTEMMNLKTSSSYHYAHPPAQSQVKPTMNVMKRLWDLYDDISSSDEDNDDSSKTTPPKHNSKPRQQQQQSIWDFYDDITADEEERVDMKEVRHCWT